MRRLNYNWTLLVNKNVKISRRGIVKKELMSRHGKAENICDRGIKMLTKLTLSTRMHFLLQENIHLVVILHILPQKKKPKK